MGLSVKRLGPDDAKAYRGLRLEALADTPVAFGESVEEARDRPVADWQALLAGERAFFGVFDADRLVACANYLPQPGEKTRHLGWIFGVYVSPPARGKGTSDLLIGAVLAHARAEGALQVHLGVWTENRPALRLYERFGFSTYGTQPRALLVDGRFIDEHQMVCFLDKEDE
ncbi:GNAT family N-acetyltransferase [Pelagibacterium sediminicola]|uniref:GNAT family N-acetyltransferase n=1 Tax=Pelagibacterium sediminicola TaxID=2248761 RepID=UPI000E30FFD8|nr:GNAT family N-acetyltransferase [Pelagibacterium sediminicola]